MPDNVETLYTIGPFKGIDSRHGDKYVAPGDAVSAFNANTYNIGGALSNFYGRQLFATFAMLASAPLTALARYDTSPTQTYFIAQNSVGATAYYDPVAGIYASLSTVTALWTRAVQSNGILFLDNGQQIFLGSDGKLHAALWQYPTPSATTYGYSAGPITATIEATLTANFTVPAVGATSMMSLSTTTPFAVNDPVSIQVGTPPFLGTVTAIAGTTLTVLAEQVPAGTTTIASGAGVAIPLAQATYTYAFVQVIAIPTAAGNISQTTSPQYGPPYTVVADGVTLDAVLSGNFAGTTSDGYAYTTQVYRESSTLVTDNPSTNVSATNNFYLLTTLNTNNSFIDNIPDSQITGNQQLTLDNEPPPTGVVSPSTGPYVGNPIESFQDRMWVLARVSDADTNNFPQTQLWYSRPGLPWSFDASLQVLLVGDENTTINGAGATGVPYGDQVAGLAKVGSYLMVFKSLSTWMVTGTDQQSFQQLPLFADIGLIAPLSLTKANGVVFWLSAEGAFSYDGANLQYISDKIYTSLQDIPPESQATAVGFYADLTWFLSFPATGQTFSYYIPEKDWQPFQGSVTAATFSPSLGSNVSPQTSFKWNQVVGVRTGTEYLDLWFANATNDLGVPQIVTWTTPINDSNQPWAQKNYRYLAVEAPVQESTLAVEVLVDPGFPNSNPSQTYTFDLSIGPLTQIIALDQDVSRGYTVQLVLTGSPNVGSTQPLEVWSVSVGGDAPRPWTILDWGGVTV